jgi:acyl-CoA synthetase (AMP-forming)/AMP-acid ligase II
MSRRPHTLVQRLIHRAGKQPDKIAIHFKERAITYGELQATAAAMASGLHALGIGSGDRVALMLRNRPEYFELSYAIWWIGAILVPVNVTFAEAEVRQTLADSGAFCCVANGDLMEMVSRARSGIESAKILINADGSKEHGDLNLRELRALAPAPIAPAAPRADRLAIIAYTSGTTGVPKGAMLDDQHLADGMDHLARYFGFGEEDNILQPFPVHAVNPCRIGTWFAINLGSTAVLMERFDAGAVARAISKYRVAYFATVPTMLFDILKVEFDEPLNFSSLRYVLYGGAPTPPALRAELESRFGIRMIQSYGSTEVARISVDPIDSPPRPGSAGKVIECAEVTVRDQFGNILRLGDIGEFWVRGAAKPDRWGFTFRPILGYWNDPAKSAEALPDGWYRTGDMGYLDKDGWLYVVDRVKDMLIRGGNNIYPAEIERVLQADPRVAFAYVVGLADERLGQIPMAYIVPKAADSPVDVDDIVAAANSKLAKIKRIERAELISSADLPRNAMNKVLKRELAARANSSAIGSVPART